MASMQELRAQAKAAGVPTSEIRSAESAEELQGLIAGAAGTTRKGKSVVRKAAKKSVAKKSTAHKTVTRKSVTKAAPAKRGRPKGSTTKKSTTKSTTRKSTNGRVRNVVSTDGRHILDGVNYSDTDGWNPRPGSAPDVILNALRRFKGNREKVFEHLKKDVWNFVGRKMQDGSKRTLSSAHDMLKYRIARTDWDFALKTGQHTKSENRVEYGTGNTGAGIFKRAKKSAAKKAPARRGRPPKSQTTKSTGKRRGRPPGSKNRSTTTRKPAAKRTMKRR